MEVPKQWAEYGWSLKSRYNTKEGPIVVLTNPRLSRVPPTDVEVISLRLEDGVLTCLGKPLIGDAPGILTLLAIGTNFRDLLSRVEEGKTVYAQAFFSNTSFRIRNRLKSCGTCGGKGYLIDISEASGQAARTSCYACGGEGKGRGPAGAPQEQRRSPQGAIADERIRDAMRNRMRQDMLDSGRYPI